MTGHAAIDVTSSFPKALRQDVEVVQAQLVPLRPALGEFEVNLSSGPVSIPYRLYLNDQHKTQLTPTQQLILECLYTRHSDGRVREAHLKELLGQHEEWVCPYVWAPLGEYVIELISLIKANTERLDRRLYSEFLARNPEFVDRTRQRAISYWDCYYRRTVFKTFDQYPSYEVFALFDVDGRENIG